MTGIALLFFGLGFLAVVLRPIPEWISNLAFLVFLAGWIGGPFNPATTVGMILAFAWAFSGGILTVKLFKLDEPARETR